MKYKLTKAEQEPVCVGIRPPYSEKRREQQRQEAKENGLPFMEKGEMNDGKN